MAKEQLKFDGRIIKHNNKNQTKGGIDMLKVTVEVKSPVGDADVLTEATFAVRADQIDNYPIGSAMPVTFGPAK